MMQSTLAQDPSVGGVLTRTVRTYQANFLPLFVLSVIVQVPLTLIGSAMTVPALERLGAFAASVQVNPSTGTVTQLDPSAMNELTATFLSLMLVLLALAFAQLVLVNAAVAHITSEHQFGRQAGMIEAFTSVSSRLPSYSIALLLVFVALVVTGAALGVVFFLCGFGIGVLAWLSLTLTTFLAPAFVMERGGLLPTLNRAWSLGKLYLWPIFRVNIAIFIVVWLVTTVVGFVVPTGSVQTGAQAGVTLNPIGTLISIMVTALITPLTPIAATLMYLDARVQYEGLDAALAALGKHGARPVDVDAPPAGPAFTGRDVTNMFILTLVTFGLVFAAFALSATLAPILNPTLFQGLGQ